MHEEIFKCHEFKFHTKTHFKVRLIILLLTQEALYNTEKKIAQYSDCFTSLCPQYN